ncbi:MAG: MFS transporter [Clostridia bacterium]|nr:MFS transporter [Clostridia bacterium]
MKKQNFGLILAVYLLGIFMGALDTGIVTPARTVIQDSLGVNDQTGIWMITIYTLAYAASIPVMGKLADRMGRRTIYLISIFLFGLGSLMCGISHSLDSFTMLLLSRAVQAIGGGGIMPVATAEFGTTFPEEKRGMALGMVGGVYGIANIFGASAGSLIMDIFGTTRWQFIFYVNVPITIFILVAGFFALPNTKDKSTKPIDGKGICILVVMILSLMYGLKNIDFFNFIETITDPGVFWYLIAFFALLPLFIVIEKRAEDPVMNLTYFTNLRILMTLCVTVITGIVLMGIIFVPQFCENALHAPSGEGGYFVILLGVFAGVGSMSSGHLTDKFGPKLVLGIGLVSAIIGALIVIFFSSVDPNKLNVYATLIFIGLGIGFTMGAPLNYMMLGEVDESESNSALATLSLVRSLGTVVAPAIMVGFIAHAGVGMSDALMDVMPKDISMPTLPYAEEFDMDMGMDMNMDMNNSSFKMPNELVLELQTCDVTTIANGAKHMARYFFDEMMPDIQAKATDGISSGISGIEEGIAKMDENIQDMTKARKGMVSGVNGMDTAIMKQQMARTELLGEYGQLKEGIGGIEQGIKGMEEAIAEIDANREMPAIAKRSAKQEIQEKLDEAIASKAQMEEGLAGIDEGIKGLDDAIANVKTKRDTLYGKYVDMGKAIEGISTGKLEAETKRDKMVEMRDAIPGAFKEAEDSYMAQIDLKKDEIEAVFQSTLNGGFRQIFEMTAICSAIGLVLLALYRRKKEDSPV